MSRTIAVAIFAGVLATSDAPLLAKADEVQPVYQLPPAVTIISWRGERQRTYDQDGNFAANVPTSDMPRPPVQVELIDVRRGRIGIELTLASQQHVLRYIDVSAATLNPQLVMPRPPPDSAPGPTNCPSGNCNAPLGIMGIATPHLSTSQLASLPPQKSPGSDVAAAVAKPLIASFDTAAMTGLPYAILRAPKKPAVIGDIECSASSPQVPASFVVTGFTSGSSEVTPPAKQDLAPVAARLSADANEGASFLLAGHADSTGSGALNSDLSLRRAEAVRRFLVSAGVPSDRLSSAGFGAGEPAIATSFGVGNPCNRRVEIFVLDHRTAANRRTYQATARPDDDSTGAAATAITGSGASGTGPAPTGDDAANPAPHPPAASGH